MIGVSVTFRLYDADIGGVMSNVKAKSARQAPAREVRKGVYHVHVNPKKGDLTIRRDLDKSLEKTRQVTDQLWRQP